MKSQMEIIKIKSLHFSSHLPLKIHAPCFKVFMIIDLTYGQGTITQGAMKKMPTFWIPARAVAKQASIAVPPFLSASIPECTAKGSVVPATRPFPLLTANGLGLSKRFRVILSILSNSFGGQVLGDNDISLLTVFEKISVAVTGKNVE